MNKSAAFLAAFFLGASCGVIHAAETTAVVVSGRALEPLPSYRAGGELYLEAKRVGEIYGGQVYWYPVSGRVQLSMRGRTMRFLVDSKSALAGEETLNMSAPVIVRASRAFLPLSLLSSEAFGLWSGYDAHFDSVTQTLQVERRSTAGPVRAFSYKGRTRLSIDLGSGVTYQATGRGVGAMEIVLPFGVVEGDEKVEIDDNVISNYVVKQEARSARVTVHFAAQGQKWKTIEQAQPRRLFVDVYALGVDPEPEAPVASSQESGAKSLALAASASSAAAKGHESSIPKKRKIIVIDAGHGGKDPGAIGLRGVREKDINLAAALELSRVLNARGDFQVVLTRENDSFVPLSDRSKIANDLNADLFVSLHCNSSLNHRESGFEVYSVSETASDPEAERLAATENAALELEGKKPEEEAAKQILLAMTKTEMINESAPFAALVQRSLGKRISVADRGAKQAGFYVLRGTHAPAILVEMAFVSHVKDEAMLGSARFRRKMAEGIAAGIAEYARKKGWLE